ncbi:hypothetical protein GUITHDRAFT_114625 [Guillardia theta CCMP2712]|uniref:Uncharacterized protein n=1 Tax=Guillardia theta (strain CCMP2712) TaxID=905079 RepID=L1ITI0_GUITC|nr:hypothetical protein GUITHDRAFT_114625 [Guillardia theta CCMP2712]EKX39194.1 hypothetical protein GUITHDRAFT_114625 [Guillardia theta CCMP2712]|eukprot:XP_005826174.1 hypothetical protein GUITHDRAFT_114625 [Guillardia theta CCMP2712]
MLGTKLVFRASSIQWGILVLDGRNKLNLQAHSAQREAAQSHTKHKPEKNQHCWHPDAAGGQPKREAAQTSSRRVRQSSNKQQEHAGGIKSLRRDTRRQPTDHWQKVKSASSASPSAKPRRQKVLARKRAATYQRLTMQLTLEALLSGARRMTPLRKQALLEPEDSSSSDFVESPEGESSPEAACLRGFALGLAMPRLGASSAVPAGTSCLMTDLLLRNKLNLHAPAACCLIGNTSSGADDRRGAGEASPSLTVTSGASGELDTTGVLAAGPRSPASSPASVGSRRSLGIAAASPPSRAATTDSATADSEASEEDYLERLLVCEASRLGWRCRVWVPAVLVLFGLVFCV